MPATPQRSCTHQPPLPVAPGASPHPTQLTTLHAATRSVSSMPASASARLAAVMATASSDPPASSTCAGAARQRTGTMALLTGPAILKTSPLRTSNPHHTNNARPPGDPREVSPPPTTVCKSSPTHTSMCPACSITAWLCAHKALHTAGRCTHNAPNVIPHPHPCAQHTYGTQQGRGTHQAVHIHHRLWEGGQLRCCLQCGLHHCAVFPLLSRLPFQGGGRGKAAGGTQVGCGWWALVGAGEAHGGAVEMI